MSYYDDFARITREIGATCILNANTESYRPLVNQIVCDFAVAVTDSGFTNLKVGIAKHPVHTLETKGYMDVLVWLDDQDNYAWRQGNYRMLSEYRMRMRLRPRSVVYDVIFFYTKKVKALQNEERAPMTETVVEYGLGSVTEAVQRMVKDAEATFEGLLLAGKKRARLNKLMNKL